MLSGGGREARGREGHSARGEQVTRPIVVRLDGNNAAAGRAILDGAGLAVIEQNDTMDGAARRAAELAASAETPAGA
jgi:succinyl-CoA synthetase beta subunit